MTATRPLIDRFHALTADMSDDETWAFTHALLPTLLGVLDEIDGGRDAFDRAVAVAKGFVR